MRVFGVPTIRYDIKKPERQSVADPQVNHSFIFFRTMQIKQLQYSFSSPNSSPPMVLEMKISKWSDLKNK